jgi:hypothetical protein
MNVTALIAEIYELNDRLEDVAATIESESLNPSDRDALLHAVQILRGTFSQIMSALSDADDEEDGNADEEIGAEE